MIHYRTTGHLIDAIQRENVGIAQEYLTEDDMAQYLDAPLNELVPVLVWNLHADGYNYHIDAYAVRELTVAEQKLLSENCSGQNSDGLGEGFEQQDFAWSDEATEDEDCSSCDAGASCEEDGSPCGDCQGDGVIYGEEGGHMCSFDWETNELPWTVVA